MGMYKRGLVWWASLQVNGKRKLFSLKTKDEALARQLFENMRARAVAKASREHFVAVADALTGGASRSSGFLVLAIYGQLPGFIKTDGRGVSERYANQLRTTVGRFQEWVLARAPEVVYIEDVTLRVAWRFVEFLDDGKRTAASIRQVTRCLSSVWGLLKRRGIATENPWLVARPSRRPDEEKTGRALSPDEVRRLLEVAPLDSIRYAILIGLYTGLRLADVKILDWSAFDWGAGLLKHTPSKTKKHGIIIETPLAPPLCDSLRPLWEKLGRPCSGLVVPCDFQSWQYFGRIWNNMLHAAGIVPGPKEKITFHSLRHTFASWLSAHGATEQERMRLGGWSQSKTAARYNHDFTREAALLSTLPVVSLPAK